MLVAFTLALIKKLELIKLSAGVVAFIGDISIIDTLDMSANIFDA